MKYKLRLLFSVLLVFIVQATFSMAPNDPNNQPQSAPQSYQPALPTRMWRFIFGGPSQQLSSHQGACPTCHNNPGSNHIDHAHLMQGNGNGGNGGLTSPTTIANMHGIMGGGGGSSSSGRYADETIIALEKEKTKQLELANAHDVLIEHERNKWFNTLVQFVHEAVEEYKKQQQDSPFEFKVTNFSDLTEPMTTLLEGHHAGLAALEALHHTNAQARLSTQLAAQKEMADKHDVAELEKERIRLQGLPQQLAHDLQKTTLLHEQAMEKLAYVGSGLTALTQDPVRMRNIALMTTGMALGIYGAKRGTQVVARHASALLMQPALVSETSRLSLNKMLFHPVKTIRQRYAKLAKPTYNPALQKQVDTYVHSIIHGLKNGQPYRHGLFYGLPGTGKTLLAQTIAKMLGKHYAIIPGANIHQFNEGQGIKMLNKLFDWAEKSNTVIFFDEADALAPSRANGTVSEKTRQILNTVLARTGTETDKFLMIAATNEPNLLDSAFLSRLDEHIKFDLPDKQTRIDLLRQFFTQYTSKQKAKTSIAINVDEQLNSIADQIDGFSGREISQLARAFIAQAAANGDNTITDAVIEEVVARKIAQKEALQNY